MLQQNVYNLKRLEFSIYTTLKGDILSHIYIYTYIQIRERSRIVEALYLG